MSLSVSSRRVAALAVASSLATVLSGAFVPAATAAPTTATTTSAATAAFAATSSWFVDPRTPAQRRAEVAVPRKPDAYRGRAQETRAVYRTRAGALAVPMRFAFGHQVGNGQALTLGGRGVYSRGSSTLTTWAKVQLRRLADSLASASSVRCEGYADYSGQTSEARSLARSRATTVCRSLATENPGLRTSAVGYGSSRPAVVGGAPSQRQLNRRVVVEMTGTRPAPSVPPVPQAQVPGAPVLDHVTGVDFTFTAPAFDGGSPVTGYELSIDGGETWGAFVYGPASSGFAFELADFTYGVEYDVRVRAVNARGAGEPSDSRVVTPVTVPEAPSDVVATGSGSSVTIAFTAPSFDGGSEVTGYQVSVDDGDWVAAVLDGNQIVLGGQSWGTHVYQVRAVNAVGASPTATSDQVVLAEPGPQAYRSEYYYSGGQVWTYVFFTTVPGALSYEAQLDGGDWLPIAVEADWITEKLGRVDDPVCGATACTGDRNIRVRAVTADGPGNPGNSFPVTYFAS